MKYSEQHEQIAKELCLMLLEKNCFASSTSFETNDEYNQYVASQVGAMYQTILTKVCEHANSN